MEVTPRVTARVRAADQRCYFCDGVIWPEAKYGLCAIGAQYRWACEPCCAAYAAVMALR